MSFVAAGCVDAAGQMMTTTTTTTAIVTTVEQLESLGFDVTPSSANFVWCKHCDRSSREIYEYLKSRQLLVRYMQFDHWGDGLRITVGTDDQLDALVTLLESMLKRS